MSLGRIFLLCLLSVLASALTLQSAQARGKPGDLRVELPARKAGLWEVTVLPHVPHGMRGVRQPPQTVRQCTRAPVERIMLFAILPAQENCRDIRVAKRKAGYDIDAVCSAHGRRVEMRMALRGDLQTVYSGTYTAEYPESPQSNSGTVSFQGRWLGPCASRQRPGDMVLPNGATVNVVDDVGRAEKHGH